MDRFWEISAKRILPAVAVLKGTLTLKTILWPFMHQVQIRPSRGFRSQGLGFRVHES